ncbi:hypothetical protein [Arthrobacter sp. NPDC093139]|uniref:hypothetical protein n=1 Tax=Arthrobacter sp. NPDC093139 TaxID=3363945 RepID=UPI00380D66F5
MRLRMAGTAGTLPAAALASMVLVIAGCSGSNAGADGAAQVAVEFHKMVSSGDPSAGCGLLAPAVVEKLENGSAGTCGEKLSALNLPPATRATEAKAYGSSAQVLLDEDTVFLTRSGDSWKITAAGCTSRGERPYDCDVEGG